MGPALWIFGYGSLVWRPAFEHLESWPATVRGFRRVFWQGSTDHRGVPGAPGRVATVVPDEAASCAGRVYGVAAEQVATVLAALDHRERGGYERLEVDVHVTVRGDPTVARPAAGRRLRSSMYAATPDNGSYLGPAPLCEIARQVCAASGPSGHNADYVLELAAALRSMGADDPHVFALERLVRAERAA
jgi:cation transport regulator ChaC